MSKKMRPMVKTRRGPERAIKTPERFLSSEVDEKFVDSQQHYLRDFKESKVSKSH